MGNEEVEGVRALHAALKERPMDYVMLDTQAGFLLKKAQTASTQEQKEERLRMALGCADRSTIAAPSEFGTWARLAEVYVAMEDWENALTILNSCPMFTYQDKDAPLMPEPKDVYLPTLPETRLDEIDSEPESRYQEQVEPSLLSLRAASYRGTFKKAYGILTEMTAKIGWDQLLKIRSNVFVMEDEYRTEKQEVGPPVPAKRGPSTDVLRGTPEPTTNGDQSDEDTTEADSKPTNTGETGQSSVSNGDGGDVEKPTVAADPGEPKVEENVRTQAPTGPLLLTELISFTGKHNSARREPIPIEQQASLRALVGQPVHGSVRGPARIHYLAHTDGAVPRSIYAIQEIRRGMGDPRLSRTPPSAHRGSCRGLPCMPFPAFQSQGPDRDFEGI